MKSTVYTTFDKFKEWIMPLFAQTFSPKGTSFIHPNAYEQFGDRMLNEYDYDAEREQFLVKQTKLYIKFFLDRAQSHNTNTEFLDKLTNKIAKYFSYYVINKYPIPENGKSINKLLMRVQAELKKVLFDDNAYIAYLNQKRAEKHDFRSKPKSERKRVLHEQRRQDALDAYRRTCQIKGVFVTAQNTPRKKR